MSMDNAEFEEKMLRWGVKPPDDSKEKVPEKKENSEVVKYGPSDFLEIGNKSLLTEEWCFKQFEHPKDAVEALRKGNRLAEAAATLFGYCYTKAYGNLEKGLESDRQMMVLFQEQFKKGELNDKDWKFWHTFYNRNIDMYSELIAFRDEFSMDDIKYPHGPKGKALQSYVEVMLRAALTILRGNDSKEYDLDLHEFLIKAYQIIRSGGVREAENFTVEEFECDGKDVYKGVLDLLACMACAVVCYSYAHMESQLKKPQNDPDYESAFLAYVKSTTFVNKMGLSTEYVEFPPFLCKGIDDEQLRKILDDTWEQVKRNPGMVKNWREMHDAFKELDKIVSSHWDAIDSPFWVFLLRQEEFCKGHMDFPDLMKLIKQAEIERHKIRMQIDFFSEGLWECLEGETRQKIISAESEWHDGSDRGSFVKSAIEYYSSAIETELHSIIFDKENVQRCVGDMLEKQRKDKKIKTSSDTLPLSYMAKLLRDVKDDRPDVKPIKDVIKALPSSPKQKECLTKGKFTEFLDHVYATRNMPAHRIKGAILDSIHSLRKEILGIGCPGYLVELAEIKKQIQTASKNG